MNPKLKSIIFLSIIFNFIFVRPLSANEETSVQYYFDDRYKSHSDSERIAILANQRVFYRHADIFKEALEIYSQSHQNISYSECKENNVSDLIVKLEPDFFFNPLVQTIYADLNYYIYKEPSKLIKRGTLTAKKIINIQILYDVQLTYIYLEFLNNLSEKLLDSNVQGQTINGEFCKLI